MTLWKLHGSFCKEMPFYKPWQKKENETFSFKDTIKNNNKEEKILGATIDNRLLCRIEYC